MAGGISREPDGGDRNWSAREIARRNRESVGKPLSPVMKTAVTACELAHGKAAEEQRHRSSHSGESPDDSLNPATTR